MKILVGLSGGVDSATTAAILKKEGHEVIGITMSIWGDKKASSVKSVHNACLGPNEKEDIEYLLDRVFEYGSITLIG